MLRTTQRIAPRQDADADTVTLYHATPGSNDASIRGRGLLTALSEGALKAVWLCEGSRMHWAAMHAVRRHGGRIEDVIVYKVVVPRAWLRSHGGAVSGLYRSARDIPPTYFRGILGWHTLSAARLRFMPNVKIVQR